MYFLMKYWLWEKESNPVTCKKVVRTWNLNWVVACRWHPAEIHFLPKTTLQMTWAILLVTGCRKRHFLFLSGMKSLALVPQHGSKSTWHGQEDNLLNHNLTKTLCVVWVCAAQPTASFKKHIVVYGMLVIMLSGYDSVTSLSQINTLWFGKWSKCFLKIFAVKM